MKKIVLTCLILISTILITSGQSRKVTLHTGIGMPEALHAGVLFQTGPHYRLGILAGGNPAFSEPDVRYLAGGISHQWHFGSSQNFPETHPWFVRQGFIYANDRSVYEDFDYLFMSLTAGRELQLGLRAGISFELGSFFTLFERGRQLREPESYAVDIDLKDYPFLPAGRIGFYYKI